MFKGLRKNGEETPLDHIPKADICHEWFMNAYRTLSYSTNENGTIPLSELKVYERSFGLIGSFREFVTIIYAMTDSYLKFKK